MGDEQDIAELFDEEVTGDPAVDEAEHPDDEWHQVHGDADDDDPDTTADPLLVELDRVAVDDELEERAHRAASAPGLDARTLELADAAGLADDQGDEARDVWRSAHTEH